MADHLPGSEDEEVRRLPRRATMPVDGSKLRPSAAFRPLRPFPTSPPQPIRRGIYANDRFYIEVEDNAEGYEHANYRRRAEDHRPGAGAYVDSPPRPHGSYLQPPPPTEIAWDSRYNQDDGDWGQVKQEWESDSSDDESDAESRYDYTPSYNSASVTTTKERESSIESTTPLPTLSDSTAPGLKVKMMHVYESQYTGDACPGGLHTSNLTLLNEPRHLQHTLLRWGHLEQDPMSFNEFSDQVAKIPNLTSFEKNATAKLLRDVKRKRLKVKKTTAGTHQYITPGIMTRPLDPDETHQSPTSPTPSVSWINLPFFHLKEYSSKAQPSISCPALTLMQADFPQHTKKRDMDQVVRLVQGGLAETCFHVSQMWAIVVDKSLLVSCSALSVQSDKALRSAHIKTTNLTTPPPKESSSDASQARILVSYQGNVLWALPLRDCQTWFSFIVHFWEFWPRNVRFYRHKKLLAADDWSNIVRSARNPNSKIVVEAVLKSLPSAPVRGVLTPVQTKKRPETAQVNKTASNASVSAASVPDQNTFVDSPAPSQEREDFSVFTWLIPEPGVSRSTAAQAELGHLDRFIRQCTRNKDKRSYAECPEATSQEIRYLLLNLSRERSFQQLDHDSKLRGALDDRIDIFNAAIMVFEFFLPLQSSGHLVGKFWGALKVLLDRPWPPNTEDVSNVPKFTSRQRAADQNIPQVRKRFRELSRQIKLFQQIMVHAEESDRARFDVPPKLFQAWIYLVLATVQSAHDYETYRSHIDKSVSLLEDGMRSILQSFSPLPLLTWSSLLPADLLSQISLDLIGDVTKENLNITNVYSEYIDRLTNEVETNPAVSHQETIQRLIREIDVVLYVLKQQIYIFRKLLPRALPTHNPFHPPENPFHPLGRVYPEAYSHHDPVPVHERRIAGERPEFYYETKKEELPYTYVVADSDNGYAREQDGGPKLSSTDPGGFRELLVNDCQSAIYQRIEEFKNFKRQAHDLDTNNQQKAQTRKDHQEQAIYAFTIVTVIFLPLSTIAGIFGMNTTDIRDIEHSQWLYWATAIPVTALVILGGLWWMGELANAALWILDVRQPSVKKAGSSGRSESSSEYSEDESYRYPPAGRRHRY